MGMVSQMMLPVPEMVEKIIVHESYDDNTNNYDIALLKLTHYVDYSSEFTVYNGQVSQNMLCAGDMKGSKDSCQVTKEDTRTHQRTTDSSYFHTASYMMSTNLILCRSIPSFPFLFFSSLPLHLHFCLPLPLPLPSSTRGTVEVLWCVKTQTSAGT